MTSERAARQRDEAEPAQQAGAVQQAGDPEPAEPGAAGLAQVYSDDEAEVIAERLAALGYIE
jgi:hypothetical protein